MMSTEKMDIPEEMQSTLVPEIMEPETEFKFRCHKDISCFNACCKRTDLTLTPYDILRLRQHLELSSEAFLKNHTVPFEMDAHGTPGIKMRTDNEGACLFVREEGCSVYEDRPSSCRLYGLGSLAKHDQGTSGEHFIHFKNKEAHCKGWDEDNTQTVKEFTAAQGVDVYEEYNKDWMRLMLKKKSAGPSIGKPSELSLQLFFMASYDLDRFKRFIQSPSFSKIFTLDKAEFDKICSDDLELLKFGGRFMLHVLFGEQSVPVVENAAEKRYEERKDIIDMRYKAEVEAHNIKAEELKKEALRVDDDRQDDGHDADSCHDKSCK